MTAPNGRPPTVARRFGYLVAAGITALMAYVLNVWPGWERIPFVTGAAADVMGVVNVALLAGVAFNLVYLAYDPPRFKAFGDLVATAAGLVVLVRLWQVYPFDFSGYAFSWDAVTRTLIVLGTVASGIGILTQLVILARGGMTRRREAAR